MPRQAAQQDALHAGRALTSHRAHRRRMQYTAPKSVLNSIPTDANDSVRPSSLRPPTLGIPESSCFFGIPSAGKRCPCHDANAA